MPRVVRKARSLGKLIGMSPREVEPEFRRKLITLLVLSSPLLILIVAELYFLFGDDNVIGMVLGIVVLAYLLVLYIWRWRNGLTFTELRRHR